MKMNCMICKTELSGGLDTYGDVGSEVCRECHLDLMPDAWELPFEYTKEYGHMLRGGDATLPLIPSAPDTAELG